MSTDQTPSNPAPAFLTHPETGDVIPTARLYARGTPVRAVRLDDTRWAAINAAAAATGGTASDVMRDALDAYLDRRP